MYCTLIPTEIQRIFIEAVPGAPLSFPESGRILDSPVLKIPKCLKISPGGNIPSLNNKAPAFQIPSKYSQPENVYNFL